MTVGSCGQGLGQGFASTDRLHSEAATFSPSPQPCTAPLSLCHVAESPDAGRTTSCPEAHAVKRQSQQRDAPAWQVPRLATQGEQGATAGERLLIRRGGGSSDLGTLKPGFREDAHHTSAIWKRHRRDERILLGPQRQWRSEAGVGPTHVWSAVQLGCLGRARRQVPRQ